MCTCVCARAHAYITYFVYYVYIYTHTHTYMHTHVNMFTLYEQNSNRALDELVGFADPGNKPFALHPHDTH
jgi:hypothetical protein